MPYITVPGPELLIRPIAPLRIQGDLQAIVARSESLPSRRNIQVLTDGATVVLRGQVANDRERRLAEGMLRLSPGVRELRNELAIPGESAGP
jgi:osmotically-inducible protein OsmY